MLSVHNPKLKIVVMLSIIVTLSMGLWHDIEGKEVKYPKILVNKFAWDAALQTVNFMPLISADPWSGVIITDWYTINQKERFKIVVYILESGLTSQTVTVKLFKQIKKEKMWEDSPINQYMISQIEDSILNTARNLQINNMLGAK